MITKEKAQILENNIRNEIENLITKYKDFIEYWNFGYSNHPNEDTEGYYLFVTNEDDEVVIDICSIKESYEFINKVKESLIKAFN